MPASRCSASCFVITSSAWSSVAQFGRLEWTMFRHATCTDGSARRKNPVHVRIHDRSGSTASISARRTSPSGMAGWPRTTPRIAGSCVGGQLRLPIEQDRRASEIRFGRPGAGIDPVEVVRQDAECRRKTRVPAAALDVLHHLSLPVLWLLLTTCSDRHTSMTKCGSKFGLSQVRRPICG